jgi:hypothetical protein
MLIEQPAPTQSRTGPTYGRLCRKHKDYDASLWHKLDLLHKGGWAMAENAGLFILQAPRENPAYYEWRCKSTSYVNYLARLIGYLTGSLFTESLVMGPEKSSDEEEAPSLPDLKFYPEFWKNCDRKGTNFSQFMRATLASAMVKRRAIVQIDMPPAPALADGALPINRAQEEALGGGQAYLFHIELEDLFHWKKDDKGNFIWCTVHKVVYDDADPLGDHSSYRHQFKIWRIVGGVACYSIYQTPLVTSDDELKDDTELEVVVELSPTSYPSIPIRELELPEALWVGNQAGPLCQEHFRRRSDLMGSLCRNLVEMPYVKLGSELGGQRGSLPSNVQQDPNRGHDLRGQVEDNGAVLLGADDEIGYAGPSGVAHEIASREAKDTREEIFASVNAMALQLENSASAVGRSGESKAEDRGAMGIILTFLSDEMHEYAQRVMQSVSAGRGETVAWAAGGLSTFDAEDRQQLVAEATQLEPIRIPSRTYRVKRLTALAHATVPKATAQEKQAIAKEINANVSNEEVTMDIFERTKRLTKAASEPDSEEEEDPKPSKSDDES